VEFADFLKLRVKVDTLIFVEWACNLISGS